MLAYNLNDTDLDYGGKTHTARTVLIHTGRLYVSHQYILISLKSENGIFCTVYGEHNVLRWSSTPNKGPAEEPLAISRASEQRVDDGLHARFLSTERGELLLTSRRHLNG